MSTVAPLDFSKQRIAVTKHDSPPEPSPIEGDVPIKQEWKASKPEGAANAKGKSALTRLLGEEKTKDAPTPVLFTLGPNSSEDSKSSELSRGPSRSSSISQTPPVKTTGFMIGAGEIGRVSSPRYSGSVQSRDRGSVGSVEARFIVNFPQSTTPQTSSSILGRSLSKLSFSNRSSDRTSDRSSVLAKTPNSNSMLNIRRFVDKPWKGTPDESPFGSVDSRASSRIGSPYGSHTTLSSLSTTPRTTGGLDDFQRRGSLSKSYGKLGKTLGEGAGGHVKIIKSAKDGKIFAVKEFRAKHPTESSRDYQKKIGGEYCLGMTLKHPNIVETIDIIYEPEKVYQILEYCDYDLFALVMSGKMSQQEVFCDFRQILSGVRYLHESGIAHRDLKLDNCVVNYAGIVKIIDFGSSVVFKYPESDKIYDSQGVVGSDPYLAPEAATGDRYDPPATDVWSTAIMLCCMLMKKFPWRAPRMSDTAFSAFVSKEGASRPGLEKLLCSLPIQIHPLIVGMLDLDPAKRFTIEQCWNDEWILSDTYCSEQNPLSEPKPLDHSHSTVPFEEAHIAMLERKNRKAKKSDKMW